nr:NAD-dependent epimerase/dehydratase family protein [Elusimicrobiales bacterium]
EAYIAAFCRQCGAKAWIIRFPNVIGSRATHGVILDFVRKLKKNPRRLEVLGNGRQCKPYLHVDDLVRAMLLVWRRAGGELNCFNVAGRGRSRVAGIAAETIKAAGLEGVNLRFGKENRGWKGDVPQFDYNLKKISRLGWRAGLASGAAVKKAAKQIWEQEGRK